jgi:hypothetical protein
MQQVSHNYIYVHAIAFDLWDKDGILHGRREWVGQDQSRILGSRATDLFNEGSLEKKQGSTFDRLSLKYIEAASLHR